MKWSSGGLFFVVTVSWAAHFQGCAGGPDLEAYGLPRVEIRTSHAISLENAPAELRWKGRVIPGHVSLSGDGSLDHPKRSYRFDPSLADERLEVGSIKLAAQVQDPSLLRTLLGARALRAGLGEHPDVEPVSLFLNGRFQGLYLRIERIDESYFARRQRMPERLYKSKPRRALFDREMVIDPESGFESKLGGFHPGELRRTAAWAERGGPEPPLDLVQGLRYFAVQVFLGNCDGLINNLYLVRERHEPRLRFVPWDWERSYDGTCGAGELLEINRLAARLLAHPTLSQEASDLFARLIDVEFAPGEARALLESEVTRITEAYRADPFLGGLGLEPRSEMERLLALQEGWIAALRRELALRYPRFR